jgi:hypothetical protein
MRLKGARASALVLGGALAGGAGELTPDGRQSAPVTAEHRGS